jgi:hypothetical protein
LNFFGTKEAMMSNVEIFKKIYDDGFFFHKVVSGDAEKLIGLTTSLAGGDDYIFIVSDVQYTSPKVVNISKDELDQIYKLVRNDLEKFSRDDRNGEKNQEQR